MLLQAAYEEVKNPAPLQQGFCLLFPTQTMGFLALADSSGSWKDDAHLACLLSLQTLLDQVAPTLLGPSLLNDDASLVLLKESAQHVNKVLNSAPKSYGPCWLTAVLRVGTTVSIVHAGGNRLSLASLSLPLYQVTRDDLDVGPGGIMRGGSPRALGQGRSNEPLDAMQLSLSPNDTLLLGTASFWRRLPETAPAEAVRRWFDDPVQLCHHLFISSVDAHQKKGNFSHLIVMQARAADPEAIAQMPPMQVIHLPEQLVLPKSSREWQQ